MAGPVEVAPGTSAPFKALLDSVATLSDVSEEAEWISSNPSVLSVETGLATGHVAGEATVTARFEEQQTNPKLVMVLPAGTYRLRGTVHCRPGPTPFPISMARVEVPAVGLATTTDAQGRFALYGVPQDAEIMSRKMATLRPSRGSSLRSRSAMNGSANVAASDLAGYFYGRIALYEPSTGEAVARCNAEAFPFSLTR